MAKKISTDDISYAEIMLLVLSEKIDIELKNVDFNYLLDENYALDYLIYPLAGASLQLVPFILFSSTM